MNQTNKAVKIVFQGLLIFFVIGLFYSQFLISMSTGLMVATAIFSFFHNKSLQTFSWAAYLKDYGYSAISLIFIGVFISGLWSDDTTEWLHQVKMKLVFLILPWSFYVIQRNTDIDYRKFLKFFVVVCTISSIPVIIRYSLHVEEYTHLLGQGIPIPTPINHIIYSLFLAFSVLYLASSWIQQPNIISKSNNIIAITIVYLIVVIHLLAIRSGIAIFYGSSFVLITIYIIKYKKYLYGLLFYSFLTLIPIVAYHNVPSFQKRIRYMLYDYDQYMQGNASNYSDSGRLYSLEVGLNVWLDHPIIGTGIGDLKKDCSQKYKELYDWDTNQKLYPHNQYLFILAGTGVLGFILFGLGLVIPFIAHGNYKDIKFISLYLAYNMSFLVNNSFERSVGFSFFIFCLLVLMKPKEITSIK